MFVDHLEKMRRVRWLRDISGHTRVQAAFAVAVHGVRRHGDDGKRFPARVSADDPRRLQTVEHRHLDVISIRSYSPLSSFATASRPSFAKSRVNPRLRRTAV